MPALRIEDAIQIANHFFNTQFHDKGLKDVLLEEVKEKTAEEWEVTIGFSRVVEEPPIMHAITQGPKYERVYKAFVIEKVTGNVRAMMFRQMQGEQT